MHPLIFQKVPWVSTIFIAVGGLQHRGHCKPFSSSFIIAKVLPVKHPESCWTRIEHGVQGLCGRAGGFRWKSTLAAAEQNKTTLISTHVRPHFLLLLGPTQIGHLQPMSHFYVICLYIWPFWAILGLSNFYASILKRAIQIFFNRFAYFGHFVGISGRYWLFSTSWPKLSKDYWNWPKLCGNWPNDSPEQPHWPKLTGRWRCKEQTSCLLLLLFFKGFWQCPSKCFPWYLNCYCLNFFQSNFHNSFEFEFSHWMRAGTLNFVISLSIVV